MSRWEIHLKAAGRSPQTIALRLYQMRRCAEDLGRGVDEVTLEDLETWLANPAWSPSTRRAFRAAVCIFYAWAVRGGLVDASPAALLPTVKVPRSLPRPAEDDVYLAALAAATDRERRALRLGAECGLRRGEIARVRGSDVVPDLVGWSLRVVGKGGHVRMVPMPDDLAAELRRLGSDWVFPSPRRPGAPLTAAHLGKVVSRLMPDGVATHALRHRAGTKAYDGTMDLRAVQEFLGHAKPETTAIYTRVTRDAIRAAMRAAAA